MRQPKLEFSRPLRVDRIPVKGSFEKISAEASELEMLSRRFGLPAIHAVHATIKAQPWRGGGVRLEGLVEADIEQISVVSLEPFRSTIECPITRYFLPTGKATQNESDEDDIDEIINGEIDLGEVVAETVALELDPYPRAPGETFEGFETGSDAPASAKVSPFVRLKKDT